MAIFQTSTMLVVSLKFNFYRIGQTKMIAKIHFLIHSRDDIIQRYTIIQGEGVTPWPQMYGTILKNSHFYYFSTIIFSPSNAFDENSCLNPVKMRHHLSQSFVGKL